MSKNESNIIRTDYLTGTKVCFATERSKRPKHFNISGGVLEDSRENCPFCPENENIVPETVYRSEDNRVRVVTNKYPVVSEDSPAGFGKHEVLIDTPEHFEKLQDFSVEDLVTVFKCIKSRISFHRNSENVKHIQIFKNEGSRAGASISHSHWQLITLPFVPDKNQRIHDNFIRFRKDTGECFLCRRDTADFLVYENEAFVAFMSDTALYSNSVDIMPKGHYSSFVDFDDGDFYFLADVLKRVLLSYRGVFGEYSYNICFQDSCEGDGVHHFFMQILPRMYGIAGFELSTGCFINSVDPKEGAKNLRRIINGN